MMNSCSGPDDNQFFDAIEEEVSDCSGYSSSNSVHGDETLYSVSSNVQFDLWIQNPESVEARRSKFFDWLGLDGNKVSWDDLEQSSEREDFQLRNTSFECEFESSRSPVSFYSGYESEFSGHLGVKENVDEAVKGNVGDDEHDLSLDGRVRAQQFDQCLSTSSSSGDRLPIESSTTRSSVGPTKNSKKWWMNKLRSFSCVDSEREGCSCDSVDGGVLQRVKIHQSKKQTKELSALYYGQNIRAHKGAILTMKFSPDGRFLASAGEDKVVRVWQVVEVDRTNELDIPGMDPSCLYFTINHLSELKPQSTDKQKNRKLKRTSDSACVIVPPKVFRLLENPLHEFRGHTGEVLDLSWSKSNCLLSASADKTVRLWKVGTDHCLNIFPHNNYVTCIHFNPVDDNCFISGSIDGKVRIWEISDCKVINWTETKDIVTAVCYRPDGQGGIIGSIAGGCRFYSIRDNQLELDSQIFLHNKKKSSEKRINGFQFLPQDPGKVMVSCTDSQVRILQGVNVIGKYKGQLRTGALSMAYFTADGRRIVGASEDSNVYVWKCNDQDLTSSSHIKSIKSYERFLCDASVALPWPGFQNEPNRSEWRSAAFNGLNHGTSPYLSPPLISCRQEFFLELYYPRGSALWPEEKLVSQSPPSLASSMHKSDYRFLKACQSRVDSDAWGMVIVTAGWDGRIRTFHNYGLPVPH